MAGRPNSWSIAEAGDANAVELSIELSIQGYSKTGYHLVICPDGYSSADSSYDSIDEAKEDVFEMFGVNQHEWTTVK